MPAISPFLLTHAQSNQGLEALNGPALAFPDQAFCSRPVLTFLPAQIDILVGPPRAA
jgi:hypothetical protein